MIDTIKLISLNIEGEAHIDIQKLFFNQSNPEIICLQEIFESTYYDLKKSLNMDGVFVPMWKRPLEKNGKTQYEVMGIATFSKFTVKKLATHYYHGGPQDIFEFIPEVTPQTLVSRALLVTELQIRKGVSLTVANTHFTWSRDARVSKQQEIDLESMLKYLASYPSIVFCGDLNAPRGGQIFNAISQLYTDWVPAKYTSSIDGNLHYAGQLNVMVDGLFSTKDHCIENVSLVNGVSDHCAVLAYIKIDN